MLERLERMRTDAEATLRKYEELSAELGADAVEVHSDDGLILVRLDKNGRVDDIRIDEMAMRHRQTLGPIIVSLIEEATATYGLKMAEMAQELAGDKIDVAGMIDRQMPEHMRERARENLDRRRD
jgi:DNA-binding protein YbaB